MGVIDSSLFRFGSFELDLEREQLLRDGVAVKLHAQPFRLLAELVRREGEVVTRDEIRRTVWEPDTFVDFEQGINTCVRQIRQALGDAAGRPRFLQTVPRKGYRFIGPVTRPGSGRTATPGWAFAPAVSAGWSVAVTAAVALALLVGWIVAAAVRPASPADDRPVVAILPFEDYSIDGEESYLGDALTEELIAQLGRRYARRMSVIARTSAMKYKETPKSIREIAGELDADYLLEGSVRREADKVRITAQLIRAVDESHTWASSYERGMDDLLQVQVEIGELVAQALAIKILPDDSHPADPGMVATTPEAYELYLRAKHGLESRELAARVEARGLFERVIELDPAFAPAYVGLSNALSLTDPGEQTQERSKRALMRAIALDDELPSAHLAMGNLLFYRDYDLEGARRAYRRALEIQPDYSEAHHALAAVYSVRGRHNLAIAEVQAARRIDPLSSMVSSDVGWYYYFAREFEQAEHYCRRTLELDPGFYWAELCIWLSLRERDEWSELIERGRALIAKRDPEAPELARLDDADPAEAQRSIWQWRARRLEEVAKDRFIPPADMAQMYMAAGREDRALELLERGFETRTGWILPFLTVDPLFDPLRGDPRFDDLVARVSAGS